MSASEKMRALEHPAKTQLDVVNNALRLHEAQAQVVAVVEKAEQPVWDRKHQRHVCSQCGAQLAVVPERDKHRPGCPLAALEEALS